MFKATVPFSLLTTQVSLLLPPRARELLIAAAAVDATKGRGESMERRSALDAAITRVKRTYPKFFKD